MSRLPFLGEERRVAMDRAAGPLPRISTSQESVDVGVSGCSELVVA